MKYRKVCWWEGPHRPITLDGRAEESNFGEKKKPRKKKEADLENL